MQLAESSIYIGLKRLRRMLYSAVFTMEKCRRPVFGDALMRESEEAIGFFTAAFTVTDRAEKTMYLDRAIAAYAVLRTDIEFCTEENIFHFRRGKATPEDAARGLVNDDGKRISQGKIELFKTVAEIDSGLCKWRASLAKGRSITG